jgi:hypothetical protein
MKIMTVAEDKIFERERKKRKVGQCRGSLADVPYSTHSDGTRVAAKLRPSRLQPPAASSFQFETEPNIVSWPFPCIAFSRYVLGCRYRR